MKKRSLKSLIPPVLVIFTIFSAAGPAAYGVITYEFAAAWGTKGSEIDQFHSPRDMAFDADGNLYVVDLNNYRVQEFNGQSWTTFINNGKGELDGQLHRPFGLDIDSAGNFYLTDNLNHRVQMYDSTGAFVQNWGGFTDPMGLAIAPDDTVYVADAQGNVIRKFDGTSWTIFAGTGVAGNGPDELSYPLCTAVDSAGFVYVTDRGNERVRKYDADGTLIAEWGSQGHKAGEFEGLYGIAIDLLGDVFVVDYGNHRVQKFTDDGQFLTMWGFGPTDVPGFFNGPTCIAVDDFGNVYVSDDVNNRVQMFVPVPEPATLILTGLGGLCIARRRRAASK